MRKCRLFVIGGMALLGTAATALAAVGTSGNQQGIDFARAQQRAYNKVSEVSYTQTGFVAMLGHTNQVATETDTDSAQTLLAESGQVRVARGPGHGRPAFTFAFTYGYPAHATARPRVNRCRA